MKKKKYLFLNILAAFFLSGCNVNYTVPKGFVSCNEIEVKSIYFGKVLLNAKHSFSAEEVYKYETESGKRIYANQKGRPTETSRNHEIHVKGSQERYFFKGYVGAIKVEYNNYLNVDEKKVIQEEIYTKIPGNNPVDGTAKGNKEAYEEIKKWGFWRIDDVERSDFSWYDFDNEVPCYMIGKEDYSDGLVKQKTKEYEEDVMIFFTVRKD